MDRRLLIIILLIIIIIVAFFVLEWLGMIDFIPGVGQGSGDSAPLSDYFTLK